MMVLDGEERLMFEVCEDKMGLEHISEFKCLRCALNELGTDKEE